MHIQCSTLLVISPIPYARIVRGVLLATPLLAAPILPIGLDECVRRLGSSLSSRRVLHGNLAAGDIAARPDQAHQPLRSSKPTWVFRVWPTSLAAKHAALPAHIVIDALTPRGSRGLRLPAGAPIANENGITWL